jgi:hypothetical protein
LSSADDGTPNDILWNDSENSDKRTSSSENESATEGSLDELSDWIKKDTKEYACSANLKIPFYSGIFIITFQFKYILNFCYFNWLIANKLI